jgi:putative aminopeptidase FrvX
MNDRYIRVHITKGIPTITLGVALRYMHSNVSVIHKDDYDRSVRLVAEINHLYE